MGNYYLEELEAQAKRDRKIAARKDKLNTARAWNFNNDGSAICAGGSWQAALDAYAEYKNLEW